MWALRAAHDDPRSGHRGYTPTYEALNRRFFWPGDRIQVDQYVKACKVCAQQKSRVGLPLGAGHPLETPTGLFSAVSIDWLMLPRTAEGYDRVALYVCRLSKLIKLVPCRSTDTAEEQASLF